MKKLILVLSLLIASYSVTNGSNSSSTQAQRSGPKLFGGKAVLGEVTQVVDKIITVVQKDGEPADLTTTEVTKFIKAGRRFLLKDLKVGDEVVAVGALVPTDQTFLVRTLIVKPKALKVLQKIGLYGRVLDVGESSFTLTSPRNETPLEVNVTSQTAIRRLNKKIRLSQLSAGERVVAIVLKEDDGTLTARLVVVLGPKTPPVKEATPSAP